MAPLSINSNNLGLLLDLLLNGPDHTGPHAFVLVVCPDFDSVMHRRGIVWFDAAITSNAPISVAVKILRAGADQIEEADDA